MYPHPEEEMPYLFIDKNNPLNSFEIKVKRENEDEVTLEEILNQAKEKVEVNGYGFEFVGTYDYKEKDLDKKREISYFIDLLPFYFKKNIKFIDVSNGDSSNSFLINIKEKGGKIITCRVCSKNKIDEVLSKYEELTKSNKGEVQMFANGIIFERPKTFEYYKIKSGDTIEMGGRTREAMEFVDVTKEAGLKPGKWSKSAPKWRQWTDGLNIEAICKNKACKDGYNKKVICPIGYAVFDYIQDIDNVPCPLCKKTGLTPVTCGYTGGTMYKYSGIIVGKGKVHSEYKIVDGDFKKYDPEETGKVKWRSLKIIAKEANPEEIEKSYCVVCTNEIKIGEEKTVLHCKHQAHQTCLEDLSKTSTLSSLACTLCDIRTN